MHLDIFSKWRPEALPFRRCSFRISGALSRSVLLDELGSKSAPWLCWSLSCLDVSRRMWGGQVVVVGALCVSLMGCGVGECTRTPHLTFVMLLRPRLDVWLNTSHATRALALSGLSPLSGWTWLVHSASQRRWRENLSEARGDEGASCCVGPETFQGLCSVCTCFAYVPESLFKQIHLK